MQLEEKVDKYLVEEGDYIYLIAEKLGADMKELVLFHNDHCPAADYVDIYDLPSNVKEILLPYGKYADKQFVLHEIEREKVVLGYNNMLHLKRCPDTMHYGFMLSLYDKDEVANTVKYEVSIKWVKRLGDNYIIEVDKTSKTYINDTEPDTMMDELAVKVSSCLYPLEVIINPKNEIVGINNFELIKKRWEETKSDIREYYEGETVEKYLDLNNQTLEDEDLLLSSLQRDWFLHAYFNQIYQPYGNTYSIANTISTPFVFSGKGVEYGLEQTIGERLNEVNCMEVVMKGRYLESEIPSSYFAKYYLEEQYHTIKTMLMESSLSDKKISITISNLQNTIL